MQDAVLSRDRGARRRQEAGVIRSHRENDAGVLKENRMPVVLPPFDQPRPGVPIPAALDRGALATMDLARLHVGREEESPSDATAPQARAAGGGQRLELAAGPQSVDVILLQLG